MWSQKPHQKRINKKFFIMIEWYKKVVLENYANFDGRARRSEYWYFVLANFLISIVLQIIDAVIGLPIFGGLYGLAVLIPSIAVAVRRLHDINKSGWWILIALIPLVGAIWLIVLLATNGDQGPNQYGEDPKNFNEINEIGTPTY